VAINYKVNGHGWAEQGGNRIHRQITGGVGLFSRPDPLFCGPYLDCFGPLFNFNRHILCHNLGDAYGSRGFEPGGPALFGL